MAMEINNKKLHIHVMPVALLIGGLLAISAVALTSNRISMASGLQALLGQQKTNSAYDKTVEAGQTAAQYFSGNQTGSWKPY